MRRSAYSGRKSIRNPKPLFAPPERPAARHRAAKRDLDMPSRIGADAGTGEPDGEDLGKAGWKAGEEQASWNLRLGPLVAATRTAANSAAGEGVGGQRHHQDGGDGQHPTTPAAGRARGGPLGLGSLWVGQVAPRRCCLSQREGTGN